MEKINSAYGLTSGSIALIGLGIGLGAIATASILIKIASTEIGSNAITFNRLWIASIVFALWRGAGSARFGDRNSALKVAYTRRDLGLFAVAGTCFAASLSLWAWSLNQTSIANGTLLYNLMPVFTTVGGWLLLRRRFSGRFLRGLAVAIAGTVAIGFQDLQIAGERFLGDGAALLGAMLAAVTLLALEQLRTKFSTSEVMLWTSAIGSLVLLPVTFASETRLFPASGIGWSVVAALAILSQVAGQGLLTQSLKYFSAGIVAVSMLAIPAIAAILAFLIFSERLSLFEYLAFAVVLAGIYLAVTAPQSNAEV